MNILVSGASGLVGSACLAELTRAGHNAKPLTRGRMWDVETGRLHLDGFAPDAVIHLAGESLASGRWTADKKKRIHDSRVEATQRLAENLATLPKPPRIMFSASAIGIYGSRGDDILTESSSHGSDFLSQVCIGWEQATKPLEQTGARVVHLRIGLVLSANGGALAKMLPAFRFGLGGRLGNGSQWMSWIALEDLVQAILFLLNDQNASGPFNLVSPNPVTNQTFTKTLGKVLHRPTFLPAPLPILRLALGEFVDSALLASARVVPKRLQDQGFQFKHPELESALRSML